MSDCFVLEFIAAVPRGRGAISSDNALFESHHLEIYSAVGYQLQNEGALLE